LAVGFRERRIAVQASVLAQMPESRVLKLALLLPLLGNTAGFCQSSSVPDGRNLRPRNPFAAGNDSVKPSGQAAAPVRNPFSVSHTPAAQTGTDPKLRNEPPRDDRAPGRRAPAAARGPIATSAARSDVLVHKQSPATVNNNNRQQRGRNSSATANLQSIFGGASTPVAEAHRNANDRTQASPTRNELHDNSTDVANRLPRSIPNTSSNEEAHFPSAASPGPNSQDNRRRPADTAASNKSYRRRSVAANEHNDFANRKEVRSRTESLIGGLMRSFSRSEASTGRPSDSSSPRESIDRQAASVRSQQVTPRTTTTRTKSAPRPGSASPIRQTSSPSGDIGLNTGSTVQLDREYTVAPQRKDRSVVQRSQQSAQTPSARQPVALPSTAVDEASPIQSQAMPDSAGDRPKIIFQPAVAGQDSKGRAVLRPSVVITDLGDIKPALPSADLPSLRDSQPAPVRLAQNTAPMPLPPQPTVPLPPPQQPVHIHTDSARPPESMPMEMPFYDGAMQEDEIAPGGYAPPDGYFPEAIATDDGCMPPDCCSECGDPFCNNCGPPGSMHGCQGRLGPLGRVIDCLNGPPCYDGALGAERVMYAPFFIDTTQPLKNCRVRFDFAWDHEFPDRAEYFWAKMNLDTLPVSSSGGRGPTDPGDASASILPRSRAEQSVDYQDLRFYIERGTKRFSVGTDIPIRLVDPDTYHATSGMGDMDVVTKTVLLDGRRWQMTQLFRSYFPTGSPKKGVGNGHVSLEPGLAYRYKWSDITYFHGDLKYWFPLGGHPTHAGEVLQYGFGLSHVLHENDCFAIIPTLELVRWSIFDGDQTSPIPIDTGEQDEEEVPVFLSETVDGMDITNLYFGTRFVWDKGNDCGTRECGISTGFTLTDHHWYESILRVELRWSF
jgi:hypothetical protein